MNNSLENIKTILKEQTRFTIFFPQPLNPATQAITVLQKKTEDFRNKLDDCSSEAEVKKLFLSLSHEFKKLKKIDGFNQDKNNIQSIYDLLERKLNFEKPNNYIYEIKQKVPLGKKHFLESSHESDGLINENLIQPFLKKYNFSFFMPEDTTTTQRIISFLSNFDKEAQSFADDFGVVPSILGIHGTLGLRQSCLGFMVGGEYTSGEKTITFSHSSKKSTILHEWIHAIDNYVANKHFKLNNAGFVSSDEDLYISEETEIGKAYILLRKITSDLFAFDKKQAEIIIATQKKEALNKTWSILIGNEWYGLSDKQRGPLFTSNVLNSINNYLINNNSEDTHIIANAIEETGILTKKEALKKIKENEQILNKEIYPILKEVHKNKKGKSSLYYYGSLLSDYSSIFLLENFIKSKLSKDPERKKTAWENYYSTPEEMLARYFESQVYPKKISINNLNLKYLVILNATVFFSATSLLLTPLAFDWSMKITKDSDFQKNKNELITYLFGKESLVPQIKTSSTYERLQEKIENIIIPKKLKSI